MVAKLNDGTPVNVGVYKAYRNAGLSHNQAMAITAEVGRENSFNPNTLFGTHPDPARAILSAMSVCCHGIKGVIFKR